MAKTGEITRTFEINSTPGLRTDFNSFCLWVDVEVIYVKAANTDSQMFGEVEHVFTTVSF